MKQAFGLSVPERLGELCIPSRAAVIIYDMQAGIVPQISNGRQIALGCARLLTAAREGGFRIFFTRHLFLPNRIAGVGQLRRAMIWQHQSEPAVTQPLLLPGSPSCEVIPELAPRADEAVIDKITMSAFEGTYLNLAMRDAQLQAFIIAGIALEVGIEPTVRQGLDLNYVPILVSDLCGSKTEDDRQRSTTTMEATGEVLRSNVAELVPLMQSAYGQ